MPTNKLCKNYLWQFSPVHMMNAEQWRAYEVFHATNMLFKSTTAFSPRHNPTSESRAFQFSAPRVCNSLPVSICESQSLQTSSKDILLSVSLCHATLPVISPSTRPDSSKTSALYKSRTYLLTYKHTHATDLFRQRTMKVVIWYVGVEKSTQVLLESTWRRRRRHRRFDGRGLVNCSRTQTWTTTEHLLIILVVIIQA